MSQGSLKTALILRKRSNPGLSLHRPNANSPGNSAESFPSAGSWQSTLTPCQFSQTPGPAKPGSSNKRKRGSYGKGWLRPKPSPAVKQRPRRQREGSCSQGRGKTCSLEKYDP